MLLLLQERGKQGVRPLIHGLSGLALLLGHPTPGCCHSGDGSPTLSHNALPHQFLATFVFHLELQLLLHATGVDLYKWLHLLWAPVAKLEILLRR